MCNLSNLLTQQNLWISEKPFGGDQEIWDCYSDTSRSKMQNEIETSIASFYNMCKDNF